ncbi:protein tudor isoform X2 [Nomia melanderi]|uniref:protein tudor isoform X2 n=1 Tax=Nomia melanderi TaxID=2448451 RepID=UPI003FCD56AC
MNIQQSTELIIFVTHVEAEDSLLKIWGQVDKNSATCVERMILPLVEQFARSQGSVGSRTANLRVNALCCARFQNEGYYRAKVINIRPDAFDFTLMHILPINGIWENKVIELIKKTLWYNEYKILIHTVINNRRFIKLWYNNEDFSELLIKRHMAVGATLQEMFRPPKCMREPEVPIYQQSSKHLISNNLTSVAPMQNVNPLHCDGSDIHGYQRSVPLCCAAQQKHMMHSPVQEALVFKSRVLDVPSKHEVYVSFVEDGPHKFSVQLQSTSQILSLLMRDINNHPIEPLQEPPLPGSVCLGRYTQDKVLCRAVVMSVMENKCKLYYVDFGHTEVLPYTDIFQLPSHFINPKVLSIRFTLSGVHELNVRDEMKEYFKQIVSGKLLVLHVCPPEGPPLVQYGDLYDDGKNIKNILRQAFPTPTAAPISFGYQEPAKLSKGAEEVVHVSFVETCRKFFVQLNSNTGSLESIMNCLADFCQTAPTLSLTQLKIGLPCAALYDNQWYRAQILGINANNVKVLYVDYGNEETIPVISLRLIHDDLIKQLEAQAIKCILNGWELLPCTQEVFNQFELLTLEKQLLLRVMDVKSDGLIVDLYELERMESIKSKMLRIFVDDRKSTNEPNYQNMEKQHTVKINPNINQSENINNWQKNSQIDTWNDPQNTSTVQERHKSKSWKDESNEEKIYENRNERSNFHRNDSRNERFNKDDFSNARNERFSKDDHSNVRNERFSKDDHCNVRNERFSKDDHSNARNDRFGKDDFSNAKNERFSKDDFSNGRNVKDKWNNRNEYNDSLKGSRAGRGGRGGRNKTSGYGSKSHSSDKSWSDKDSDTSSKGSSRRGRGNTTRGNYSKRDGFSGRTQSNRFNDRDSDSSVKSGKTSSDSYYGNNKFKDRKGQGYRLTQSKINIINLNHMEEGRRCSPMRSKSDFHIPVPNIVIGSTKNCEVVYTNSPLDFFVQLSPDYTALDSVMESIASIYENGGELVRESKVFKGLYCIAQYSEDSRWYRAIVKSVEGNNATVQFVDYGNTETVDFNRLKVIQKEFLKLPTQAIHCRLFGMKNLTSTEDEIKSFENKVNGKVLEVEFVTEENGIYSVLIREVIDDCQTDTFINEEFCQGINLLQAKEAAVSRSKISTIKKQIADPDYAPLNAVWSTISHTPGTKKDVIVTWFTNSNNFYCQTLDNENEFKTMMNKIQKIYTGREPVSSTLKVGSPVIATFFEDKALYRAEIVELNKLNGHLIHYIDFGNSAVVDFQNIYPVEKEFMYLPKQAFQCSLLNIIPKDGLNWSNIDTETIDNYFNDDKYTCTFHCMKDNKYFISLNNNGNDVGSMLVENNLASFSSETKSNDITDENKIPAPVIPSEIESVDINLLNGQILRVKVSSVENVSKFYVQLPFATECENLINTYMTDKNPKVMQRLSVHEICLGTGCLVYANGVWRRAVIRNHSRSAGFDVKFIDTGAYDEILSDCVLALPGDLSVMQNQAVECSLMKTKSSPEVDTTFKKCVEGKEVIMYIDEVDNNRLIVKLFDSLGNKINVTEDIEERISPICPMSILSSTHKVLVSYADHSTSIWLQRNADYALDKNLIEALNQYYPASGKLVEPKVDLLCAAKSADGNWYRAKVINYTETEVCVNFIDYGNNEEVPRDVIMTLDSCFYTPHQLAINVSLPVTLKGTVSEQLNILQEYLSNKVFTAVFRNVNKKWIVELLYDGEKISEKLHALNLPLQQEVSETIQLSILNMEIGYKYNVYISHVDSPSQFWLQSVRDAKRLNEKQSELQIQASTFSQVDGILEEGSLCVAIYTIDNLWYRAQVLDADEDITTVRFIDYGNTDVIDNKSGNIRHIPDSWKEIKEFAIKCRLDVIPVDSEDWNAITCEKFETLVTSVESLETLVIANGITTRVDLLIDGQSVSETLVKEHLAVMIHTEDDLIDEIVDLELDPHSAFVSHVNSPSEFWVQEEKSVGDLEVMTDRFIVAHMFPKVDKIQENMLCVAKYPEDDCWYRARVVSHNDNTTRVIYIDYGNSATTTEIRAIPEDLMNVPPLSRKCRLVMPAGITEWSEQACEEFIKLAADGATIFLLDVLNDDVTSLVKLTLINENVTDLLAKFCHHPPIIEERLPPLGEENSPNVFITRVNSLNEFYVQAESKTTELNTMLKRLQAAPSFLPLNTIEVGTICAAKFPDDGNWYRAKILSHSGDSVTVNYIDYGNTVVTNEVRMLPVDIINIPALSKCCALQKPETIKSWPPEAYKKLEELSGEGETMFQFEVLDDSCDPICVKLSLNGNNVIDILVPHSDNTSYDEVEVKEKAHANEISENHERNEALNNDTVERSKCDTEQNTSSCTIKSDESLNILEEQDENTKIQDTGNSHSNSVVELTVDEIVQNMKRIITDEGEEEVETFNNSNTESLNDYDVTSVTKSLENLEMQDQLQSGNSNNEISELEIDFKVNEDTDHSHQSSNYFEQDISSSVIDINVIKTDTENLQKEKDDTENDNNLQKEKDNAKNDGILQKKENNDGNDNDLQKEIDTAESDNDLQRKTDNAENDGDPQKEKDNAESDNDIKKKTENAENDNDLQKETDNIKKDVNNFQEEGDSVINSENVSNDTLSNELEYVSLAGDVTKETEGNSKEFNKQDIEKVNITTIDDKDGSKIKGTDKNESAVLKSKENIGSQCEITNQQNTSSLIETTVSTDTNEINNINDKVEFENIPKSSE